MFFGDRLDLLLRFGRRKFFARYFFARRNLHIHDDPVGAGWNGQRRVFHVSGFFAENCAEQSLFWREFRFAFRRNLADENVARLHFCADANDSVRSEIAQSFFADIRNVSGDFFGTEFGVAGADLEFIDVNRGVNILLHDLLRDHDGVFEVVAIPRHERDEDVAAERQLTVFRIWAVSDDLTFLDVLAFLHDRLLIHAGAGVRPHELAQFVNVKSFFRVGLNPLPMLWNTAVFRDDNL